MKKLRAAVKFWSYRAISYVGLYLEILSASCRWLSYTPPGWSRRDSWRSYITEALIAAFYLPPSREEAEVGQAKQAILRQHDYLAWISAQPETIQTCLRVNERAVRALRESNRDRDQRAVERGIQVGPEFWARYEYQPVSDSSTPVFKR